VYEISRLNPVTVEQRREKEIFEKYEEYLPIEIKRRIEERRNARFLQVFDRITTLKLFSQNTEKWIQDFNEEITQEVLDAKIFGKGEDEFPELDMYMEIHERN
jgi:hypothetical protein